MCKNIESRFYKITYSPLSIIFYESLESKPLESFGKNYPQFYHKPKEAIKHLLEVREGQVAGAFHKEGLGDIDLVWGEITDSKAHKGYGLAHILDKRTAEVGEAKALEFVKELPQILQDSKLIKEMPDRYVLVTPKHTLILGKRENNTFVLSGYRDSRNKKLETKGFGGANDFTAETLDKPLSANQHANDSIESKITQDSIESVPLESNISKPKGAKRRKSNKEVASELKIESPLAKENPKDSVSLESAPQIKEIDSISLESKNNKETDSIESNVNKETKKSLENDNVRKSKVTDMIIHYTKELQNDLLAEYQKTGAPYTISDTYTKDRLSIMNKVFSDSIKKYEANKLSYNDLNKLLDYMQDMYYFRELKYKNQGMPLDLYHYAFSDKSMMQYELKRRFPNGHIDYKMDFMEKEIESKPIVLKTDGTIKSYDTLKNEYRKAIEPILGTDIRNKETGIVAQISSTGANKIKSWEAIKKSVENGFTKEEHIEAGKNIKELFEDSTYLSSEKAKNNSQDIKAVHRFTKEIDMNGKKANALLTLKESVEHGHKIYSLELQELTPLFNAKTRTTQSQQGQSHLSTHGDAGNPAAIEKIDKVDSIKSLQDLEAIFKKNNTDSVNNELFDKVFSVAKDLKVEYSNEILGNRNILGQYNATNNKITLQDFSSETILHEMIHAVSSRAIDNPQVLKPIQKHAIKSLNRIYNRLKLDSKFKGEYALGSVKEMVAELSDPAFREKLKSRNLWQRIIDSIANLFGFRKDSSNYAKISKNLSKIIDNYDTNFTKNYENIESNFTDFAKKNTIESNLDSNQRQGMIEIKVDDAKKPIKVLRNSLKTTMQPQRNIPITNKNDGRVAIITNTTISKVSSEPALLKSIENGFTKEQHFAAAERLGELYENANLKEIQEDLKNGHKDVQMPRYEIEFSLSGENVKALITLKETLYGMYKGNRLYSIELQEIAKL